jgi:uncharacterized protein with HEPN domain
VSEGFREVHPEVPWRGIIGLRNILSHDYGNVVPARLWETATQELPGLLTSLEGLIDPAEVDSTDSGPPAE